MPRAVILAGGQGTRLRPYTAVLPKPLLPIGDRPVLDIVMDQLGAAGFHHVTIATGYMGELIEAVITHRNGGHRMRIDYVREAEPLGTVGPLRQIEGLDQPFLMMNGDVLTDLDYGRLLRHHVASGAIATIATTTRHIQVTLGVVECADGEQPDRLTGFIEKPRLTYDVSMGIYCFSPEILDHIEPDTYLDLPELVRRLVARGEQVRTWRSDSYWVDLGMREDYERAVNEFETMRDRLLPERDPAGSSSEEVNSDHPSSAQPEPARPDATVTEPARSDATGAEPARSDATVTEPARSDATGAEPARSSSADPTPTTSS